MGTQFTNCGSSENLREQFNAAIADIAALRASIVGVTAKLDAENVTGLDTDYAALHDPPAVTGLNLTVT